MTEQQDYLSKMVTAALALAEAETTLGILEADRLYAAHEVSLAESALAYIKADVLYEAYEVGGLDGGNAQTRSIAADAAVETNARYIDAMAALQAARRHLACAEKAAVINKGVRNARAAELRAYQTAVNALANVMQAEAEEDTCLLEG